MMQQIVKELFRCLRAIFRVIVITFLILAFCPIYILYIFMLNLLFLHKLWPRLYWGVEGKLYRWLQAACGYWGYTAGYKIIEYGDDMTEVSNERCLVLVNHQSTADVPTMMATLQDKGCAARKTLWIMADIFKYTPFGIVSQVHGDFFIAEGKQARDKSLELLKEHLENVFWLRDRRWVIIFPEGGFLYKRRQASQTYAAKYSFPHLEHATLPRTGAIRTVLETCSPGLPYKGEPSFFYRLPSNGDSQGEDGGNMTPPSAWSSETSEEGGWHKVGHNPDAKQEEAGKILEKKQVVKQTLEVMRSKSYLNETRPPIKFVVDVTLAYESAKAVGLHDLCLAYREPAPIRVHYRVYKTEEVPWHIDKALRDWLYARWSEKERLLEDFYKTGVFAWGEEGREIKFSWLKIISQHVFYGCSIYFHWWLWVGSLWRFLGGLTQRIWA